MLFVARSGLFTCTRTAVVLWLFAVALLAVDTYLSGNEPAALARWSLLLGIAAATSTVCAVIHHARGVVLDVISWEHKRTREGPPRDGTVIPLARNGRVSR